MGVDAQGLVLDFVSNAFNRIIPLTVLMLDTKDSVTELLVTYYSGLDMDGKVRCGIGTVCVWGCVGMVHTYCDIHIYIPL